MKVKKRVGKNPLYESGVCYELSRHFKSAIERTEYPCGSLTVEELAWSLARKTADSLQKAKLLSSSGKPISDATIQYLLKVSSYMGEGELSVLESDPKAFVSKFAIHPQQRDIETTSLLCYMLSKKEPNMAGFHFKEDWMDREAKPVFQKFRRLTQEIVDGRIVCKSPFERLPLTFIKEKLERI